ncbi:MAG: phage tail protein [Rhizobiaceae bacterium]|nr:phage tail protein [Rhizobiaceae bacterium]
MVKTPRTRHSKPQREPQTIDLDPKDVREIDAADAPAPGEGASADAAGQPRASETVSLLDEAPAGGADSEPNDQSAADDAAAIAPNAGGDSAGAAVEPAEAVGTERPAEPASRSSGSTAEEPVRSSIDGGPRTPPSPTPAKRPGGASRFVAGILGGVAALILAAILQFAGLLGYPGAASDASGLQGQIDGLKAEVEAIRGGQGSAGSADLAAALDKVRTDVAALQEAMSAGAAGDAPALQAMDQRVKELESAVASLGGSSGSETAALGERIAAVESSARAAQEANDRIAGQVAALEQSLSALAARVDSQANQPKIALAIATAALKSAVDRGSPFVAELETFAAIAPDAPEIAELRAYAESGVPTREALRAETQAAAAAMIAAADPADPDAGFFDRLLQSAESLVSVRPIGEVSGTGVPETVARIEVALNAGDLDKLLAEYETLPETAKAAGTAFAERVRARRDVERLVDQAIANAMKA